MQQTHIANHFLQASVRGAQAQGISARELIESVNIPFEWLNQPDKLLTEQQVTSIIKSVWTATGDEFMGLGPQVCRKGVFALMTEYCFSAQTLGGMLSRCVRFYQSVYEGIDAEFDDENPTKDGMVSLL